MKKIYQSYYKKVKKIQIIDIQPLNIISIKGVGNPNNNPLFQEHIQALYQLSYGFRMSYKKDIIPGYFTYSVGPLEGFWSTIDNQMYDQNKEKLSYEIFIVQPDFVKRDVFLKYQEKLANKNPMIKNIEYKTIKEGLCAQILHVGSFDDEPTTVAKLEAYLAANNYEIVEDSHHEIYLSDFRRVSVDKYNTLIRYKIRRIND